jgi:hypothetical protein
MNQQATGTYAGGCHCGAVRFEAELNLEAGGGRCNCSICTKTAVTSALVKPEAFRLLSSEAALGTYEWGAQISRRFFCKQCGIHCFGRGHLAEVGGDYVAVNLNCLEGVELTGVPVQYWDGRHNNWEGGSRSEPWPIGTSEPAGAAP